MSLSSRERKPSVDDSFSRREDAAREFGIPSGRSSSSLKRERSRLTRYRPHCPNNILVFAWLYPSRRVSSQILAITSSSSLDGLDASASSLHAASPFG